MTSTTSEDVTVISQEAFAAFLQQNRVIPLSLISIFNPDRFERATQKQLSLVEPGHRFREWQSYKALEKLPEGSAPTTRVSIGGKQIVDNGVNVASGVLLIGTLKLAAPNMDSALFVKTNEGEGQIKHKLELRYRANYPEGQGGLCDISLMREVIASIPDDLLVGFHLWVNPTPDGWFRFNLVLNNWDQDRLKAKSPVALGAFDLNGIPTLDLEALGFTFV